MSAYWIGRRMGIGIGVESSRGVGVAPQYWVNAKGFSFKDVPDKALSEAGFGGIWGGDQAPKTLEHAEGDIDMELDDQSMGALLKAVFGASTPATIDTTAYKHTYTLSNTNQHTSLTITTTDPIGQLQFEKSMIDAFELNILPNELVSAKVSFKSNSSGTTAGYTATYGATKKWLGRHLAFKIAANTGALAAASKISLKSLMLRFNKNAEVSAVLSTIQPADIVNKRFEITGEITLAYEDRTYLNYVKDGSYKAVRINLIHDDTAGSTTQKYEFMLDLSKVEFEGWDPNFGLDDVVTQKLTFKALYDAGANNNVVNDCYLINKQASY